MYALYGLLAVATFAKTLFAAPTENFQSHLGIILQGPAISIPTQIHETAEVPFLPHADINSPFGSWLGQNINFSYIKPVFDQLNSTAQPLISRGEAHITVITPPEFDNVLAKTNLTIEEINGIAEQLEIQKQNFEILCLGRIKLLTKEGEDIVYQIIVKSPGLIEIRKEVFQLYIKKGGEGALFDPEAFWPHITVGFTQRDLFIENDHVFKGANVCWRPISEV
ncbi:uncharacterized protein VTP21DRAFT_3049 [Calcarisporiella thermophila]|uniref:uncharacterized protein n=1 Tax=Calcarisporiella thermophila TaxID=911321 RepID=UPI00374258A1